MNEKTCFFVMDALSSILNSPRWEAEVRSFIDEYCLTFVSFEQEEESLLDHHELFMKYQTLFDERLRERLDEHNISENDLSIALSNFCQMEHVEEERTRLLQQLLGVLDFSAFKLLCMNRNLALQGNHGGEIGDSLLPSYQPAKKRMALNLNFSKTTATAGKDPVPILADPASCTPQEVPSSSCSQDPGMEQTVQSIKSSAKTMSALGDEDERGPAIDEEIETTVRKENRDDSLLAHVLEPDNQSTGDNRHGEEGTNNFEEYANSSATETVHLDQEGCQNFKSDVVDSDYDGDMKQIQVRILTFVLCVLFHE